MKKIFTLALLATFALVSCNPNNKPGGDDPNPIQPCDQHDVDYVLSETSGIYYGNSYSASENVYNYALVLANQVNIYDIFNGDVKLAPNSQYLFLDFYSEVASSKLSLEFKVPSGVYELDVEDTTNANTVGGYYTSLVTTDDESVNAEIPFVSGTVTVTDALIDAVLVAEDGKTYHVQCPNKIIDNSKSYGNSALDSVYSTLEGDKVVDFTGEDVEIFGLNEGDYILVGKNLWSIFVDNYATAEELYLTILVDANKANPEGVYPISGDASQDCALFGYVDPYYETNGSSWYQFDEDGNVIGYAPLKEGSATITKVDEEVYTIAVTAKDDKGNTISGTCTAATTWVEMEPYSLKNLSTASKAMQIKKHLAPRKAKHALVVKR